MAGSIVFWVYSPTIYGTLTDEPTRSRYHQVATCPGNDRINAYVVDPEHQGRGYAKESAAALVDFAFSDDAVQIVRAHTLPEKNPSTSVLTACGFAFLGEVIDPEDGLVWRWERARSLS